MVFWMKNKSTAKNMVKEYVPVRIARHCVIKALSKAEWSSVLTSVLSVESHAGYVKKHWVRVWVLSNDIISHSIVSHRAVSSVGQMIELSNITNNGTIFRICCIY